MKKSDVKIGNVYTAKVSDKIVEVRIDGENRHGGWDATNLATNKKIRIKSPARLRGEANAAPKRGRGTKVAQADAVETPVAEVNQESIPKAEAKRGRAQRAEAKPKKMSGLDAAAAVLAESAEPMNAKEMIEAVETKGLWKSPGGKTPHATLYSAIIREITIKGDAARFRKADRGKFVRA
jgi:hypothetical protein